MKKIGITGGIGSGKSVVCKIFSLLGIPILDADALAKSLYDTNEDLKKEIIKNFGKDLYPHHLFDKNKMKEIVFNQKEKLELLNSIIHPIVQIESEKWMQCQTSKYAIKEAALLIETGAYKDFDEVILVSSPLDLRIKRVMQRDHITEENVLKRIHLQMPEEEKKKYATRIIFNDEENMLIPQVMKLHEIFMA